MNVLFFDRSGFCQLHKRLELGASQLPELGPDGAPGRELTPNALGLILKGVDLRQRARRARLGRPKGWAGEKLIPQFVLVSRGFRLHGGLVHAGA